MGQVGSPADLNWASLTPLGVYGLQPSLTASAGTTGPCSVWPSSSRSPAQYFSYLSGRVSKQVRDCRRLQGPRRLEANRCHILMPKARPKASLSQKRAGTRNSQPQRVWIRGVMNRGRQRNPSSTVSSYGNSKPPISTPVATLAECRVHVDSVTIALL